MYWIPIAVIWFLLAKSSKVYKPKWKSLQRDLILDCLSLNLCIQNILSYTYTESLSVRTAIASEWRQSNAYIYSPTISIHQTVHSFECRNAHVPNDVTIIIFFFFCNFQSDCTSGTFQYVWIIKEKGDFHFPCYPKRFSLFVRWHGMYLLCIVHCSELNEWINSISQLSLGWKISYFNDFSYSFSFSFAMILCVIFFGNVPFFWFNGRWRWTIFDNHWRSSHKIYNDDSVFFLAYQQKYYKGKKTNKNMKMNGKN